MKKEVINKLVKYEFEFIFEKMISFDFSIEESSESTDKLLIRSGVYIYYVDHGPFKVGKSNDNPRKRSVNGWGKQLPNPKRLLIITLNENLLHWVYALDIFIEMHFRKLNYKRFTLASRLKL